MTVGFAVEVEKLPLFKEFKKLATREEKMQGDLITELVADYVKKHGEGNPAFQLEKWVDQSDFHAFPTFGEILKPNWLDKLSDGDFKELNLAVKARSEELAASEGRRRGEWRFGK